MPILPYQMSRNPVKGDKTCKNTHNILVHLSEFMRLYISMITFTFHCKFFFCNTQCLLFYTGIMIIYTYFLICNRKRMNNFCLNGLLL